MNKHKKLMLTFIPVFISLIIVLYLSVIWFKFTPYYKDCSIIKHGMAKQDVLNLMSNYINNTTRFQTVYSDDMYWGNGIYISSIFRNHKCNIKIVNDKVDNVELYFEP